jgi:predicted TIM-barrel fold metal-dependent hydrolase
MVRQHGFKGAHMYPHWFGIRIDDPRMYPIFEKCVELDVPISFQTGQGTMRSNSRIVARPIWIDNIARDFPELKIVALHSGYPWEEELVALAIDNDNIFICPDVPPPRLWHTAILEYLKEEGRFEGLGGSNKVVWATDWPLQDQETSLKEIDALALAPQIRKKLVRDNAIRIFKLEAEMQDSRISIS